MDHQLRLAELGLRKSQGSYFTPDDVVDGLLRACLDPVLAELEARGVEALAAVRILDPTCGTGNFLIAAFDRVRAALERMGLATDVAASRAIGCVAGIDLDADAVEICRALLVEAAGGGGDARSIVERNVKCADSLIMPRQRPQTLFANDHDERGGEWETFTADIDATSGFDVVIGNPPFLSQLQRETMFTGAYMRKVKDRFGDAARGYVDPAALFLLVGLDVLKADGGRLCLIEPLSVLSTRGAAGVRQALLANATLAAVWFAEEPIFTDAAVEVWAPILQTGIDARPVAVLAGRSVTDAGTTNPPDAHDDSWGALLASRAGVPSRQWATAGTLADIASATADFRDQYYGLAGHVVDRDGGGADLPKLVTSGLIDPAHLLWGERDTTFNRTRYTSPRVVVAELSEELRTWARTRLVPKVLVATQTRILEPVVDVDGTLLPSVPVVSIEAPVGALWRVAALLVSPPIAAIAASRHLGAALSADALKLSARDIGALPLPADAERWSVAGAAFERASTSTTECERFEHLIECAEAMCAAYGTNDDRELMRWWIDRLPRASPSDRALRDGEMTLSGRDPLDGVSANVTIASAGTS
jgi:SAM-dependent methyltransferase